MANYGHSTCERCGKPGLCVLNVVGNREIRVCGTCSVERVHLAQAIESRVQQRVRVA